MSHTQQQAYNALDALPEQADAEQIQTALNNAAATAPVLPWMRVKKLTDAMRTALGLLGVSGHLLEQSGDNPPQPPVIATPGIRSLHDYIVTPEGALLGYRQLPRNRYDQRLGWFSGQFQWLESHLHGDDPDLMAYADDHVQETSRMLDEILRESEGKIQAFFPEERRQATFEWLSYPFRLYAEHEERIWIKHSHYNSLLQSNNADWSRIAEEDGKGLQQFLTDYRTALMVPLSFLPDVSHPSSEKLAAEIEKLLQSDPDHWKPIIYRAFFPLHHPDFGAAKGFAEQPQSLVSLLCGDGFLRDETWLGQVGASLQHPLVRLVLEDPYHMFTKHDRLLTLMQCRHLELDPQRHPYEASQRPVISLQTVLGYDNVANLSDLLPFIQQIYGETYSVLRVLQQKAPQTLDSSLPADKLDQDIRWSIGHHACQLFAHAVAEQMRHALEQSPKEFIPPSEIKRLEQYAYACMNVDHTLDKLLVERLPTQVVWHLHHETEPAAMLEAIQTYTSHPYYLLSYYPELQEQMETRLTDLALAISDPQARLQALQSIMRQLKLGNPDNRDRIINGWVSIHAERLGVDPMTAEWDQQYQQILHDSWMLQQDNKGKDIPQFQESVGLYAPALFARLAEATETQRTNSFVTRDRLGALGGMSLLHKHLEASITDLGLNLAGDDPERAKAVADFLCGAATDQNCQLLLDRLDVTSAHGNSYQNHIRSKHWRLDNEGLYAVMKNLHRNFWVGSQDVQSIMISQMLFPPSRNTQTLLPQVMEHVLMRALPEGEPHAEDIKMLVRCYMDSVDSDSEKRILLGGLMVAAGARDVEESRGIHRQKGIGATAMRVLSALGPAGYTFAQAIHGHPSTPEDVRRDMEGSKSQVDLPLRWNIFERMDEAMIDDPVRGNGVETRQQLGRIGKLLGGGRYQYAVSTDAGVLTLKRKNIETIARRQFGIIIETLNKFIPLRPEFEPVRDMAQYAMRMSRVETDYDLLKEQSAIQTRNFDGLRIKIGNHRTVHFHVVEWRDHGQDWKLNSQAPGIHFNAIPVDVPGGQKRREDIALGLEAAENYQTLRGELQDLDRHGRNMNIEIIPSHRGEEIHIYMYDIAAIHSLFHENGTISFVPPTPAQKEVLGALMGKIIIRTQQDKNLGPDVISTVIREELAALNQHPTHPDYEMKKDYLVAMMRGLVGRGDAMTTLKAQPQKHIESLFAAFRTGEVDRTVLYGLLTTVAGKGTPLRQDEGLLASSLKLPGMLHKAFETIIGLARRQNQPDLVILHPERPVHVQQEAMRGKVLQAQRERPPNIAESIALPLIEKLYQQFVEQGRKANQSRGSGRG